MVVLKEHHKLQGEKYHTILIFERLDVVGQTTLLVDAKISSLVKLADGVGLWVWCHWKVQSLDDLY
jgi:hypothetical protein